MSDIDPRQVLSRLPDDEFFDRVAELMQLYQLASAQIHRTAQEESIPRRASNALLSGPPRVGKTELLRKIFDRLFNEGSEVVPIYYSFREPCHRAASFARDYLSQSLAQFIAFRRDDPRLISLADEPLDAIARQAAPEDYLWIRGLIDSFLRALESNDTALMVRCALSSPAVASARSQISPFVMIDNFHLLAEDNDCARQVHTEFIRALASRDRQTATYLLCGLRRPTIELIPADEELFDRLEMIRIAPMAQEHIEQMIEKTAARLRIETSDSTIELMIQQLNNDLFYIRALLDSAASQRARLKTFMEFERVYTAEVTNGRICHYLGAVLRDVAPDSRSRRAALEALELAVEARDAVPIEAVLERMNEFAIDAEPVLQRLHARELLEISYGFVNASPDPVLADYVRSVYRHEIAGARRPVAGESLLGEKLKHSYRLMMSRYNRAIEAQLVEVLSRFDFQSAPASLFDQSGFEARYRGSSRVQVRRALDEEPERVRLPQIVFVNNTVANEQSGWRLFTATGFDGGIYSDANEVLWLIALINSKEPVDVESLTRIDHRLESSAREYAHLPAVRWYISKEGFTEGASERLRSVRAHRSTYAQLDLLHDYLAKLAAEEVERRPASEFELVIPIEDEAELIAARTVEQIARGADFDQEAINQIKTSLIEACINAAEHSDSPDRRIYQRFTLEDDRLTISVSNKGNVAGWMNGNVPAASSVRGGRGRGLQIIRTLMDEVGFERTDDGTVLIMTKYLKRSTE
ncbi:MAG TPA: ATP-binding protein [Blastocatellia bacterium]|jgi:serine/threonine-protein kinase RsbW